MYNMRVAIVFRVLSNKKKKKDSIITDLLCAHRHDGFRKRFPSP